MKKTFFTAAILIALLLVSCGYNREAEGNDITYIREGVGFGTIIAIVASWSRNQSILWAILHGIFSWFYVIYFALTRENKQKL